MVGSIPERGFSLLLSPSGKPAVFDPFLLEPLPKEENATVFLLWTPPFPFDYWVVPWLTDAKGTVLRRRVASSGDRRDV